MTKEEKVLILGSLFHDIGKFEQRCTNNPDKISHDILGAALLNSGRFKHRFEKVVGNENFNSLINIVSEHHNQKAASLTEITKLADHLSASERVSAEKDAENRIIWKNKYLASLFTKISLMDDAGLKPKYYKHACLTDPDHNIIIPHELTEDEIKARDYSYTASDFERFKDELEAVLDFYENDDDFDSLINLLVLLFEKWMWCIPDFTGSSETDISLFNHSKDVAAIAHALYLTKNDKADSNNLNLIIGDIPGIQKYIFDVVNKKPAKVLRGRSIYVQVLTRNFASLILRECGLTEANLIMLAGGKFYILGPDTQSFEEAYKIALEKIDNYLLDNFRMELSFNSCCYTFDYHKLKNKDISFGQIIEDASFKLLENKHLLYRDRLFSRDSIHKENFIRKENYIDYDVSGTDSVKCKVTSKPIRRDRLETIKDIPDDSDVDIEILGVDRQVKNEYEIGSKVTKNNLLLHLDFNGLDILTDRIDKKSEVGDGFKLFINPQLDLLLDQFKKKKIGREFFSNTHFLEVANFCSMTENGKSVLPFEDMVKNQAGAKYLSLIKGDIDNLGLIMAYGLSDDRDDLTAISRTTTLSNHLKYFFSTFMNGFMKRWEEEGNKVYTIFAGGDDLMLITPQRGAVNMVSEFNKHFEKFACGNPEVHISYSITHFKDHSPIKIISELAEENQSRGKRITKLIQNEMLVNKGKGAFYKQNDKARTQLFGSSILNDELEEFIAHVDKLTGWTGPDLSHGLLRKLLELAEMQKKYAATKNADYLISYARTTYAVNRMKKPKPEIGAFLEKVLQVNTSNDPEADKIKNILYPLICQVIYNTRN